MVTMMHSSSSRNGSYVKSSYAFSVRRRAVQPLRAISQPQSDSSGNSRPTHKPKITEVALDPSSVESSGPFLPGVPDNTRMDSFDMARRSSLLAACGMATVWWLGLFPQSATDHRAIERVVANMTFEDARYACLDAAGVCGTLHSQVSSTLRQLTTGYIQDSTFQAACQRRLSSPFIQDALVSLEEALPVIGMELAYAPDLTGVGWFLAASGFPRLNPAARERFEGMTLRAIQRCRRVQRLSIAMNENKYTPAAVQLLVKDLQEISRILDEMLAEVDIMFRAKGVWK